MGAEPKPMLLDTSCLNPDPDLPGFRDRDGFLCNARAVKDLDAYHAKNNFEQRQRIHRDLAGVSGMLVRHQERIEKGSAPKERGPKWFTTKASIAYAKSRGWTVLARETYNAHAKRLNDLVCASDILAAGPDGVVLIQGAGKSQRKPHREKFEQRGGEAKVRSLGMRFLYLEFERGQEEPVLMEWWV